MNPISYIYRTAIFLVLLLTALVVSACGRPDSTTVVDVLEQAAAQNNSDQESSAAGPLNPAKATVNARSLRVRSQPNSNAEVVGGIKQGEVYDVTGLSSDGEWVQLAIPAIAGGKGWVSANYVSVQGSITEVAIGGAAGGSLPTPTPRPGSSASLAATPGTATVKTEGVRLRVRSQPSANAEIVGFVYNGEVYPVLDTNADGSWTQIGGRVGTDNLNGGWVASEFLILN